MKSAGFAVGALALALGATSASAQGVKVGDKPAYTFHNELVNGQGVKTLADLQGRPVVVEFWGTH